MELILNTIIEILDKFEKPDINLTRKYRQRKVISLLFQKNPRDSDSLLTISVQLKIAFKFIGTNITSERNLKKEIKAQLSKAAIKQIFEYRK